MPSVAAIKLKIAVAQKRAKRESATRRNVEKIAELPAFASRAHKSGHAADVDAYLRRAYGLALKIAGSTLGDLIRRLSPTRHKGDSKTATVIAALLFATAKEMDRRQRSRYATALKLAAREGVRASNLIIFIKKRGGFKACATKYAQKPISM